MSAPLPPHDEERARREFKLLGRIEARQIARERLRAWLAAHPGIEPTPRGRHHGRG
jgi:hypothetical protein